MPRQPRSDAQRNRDAILSVARRLGRHAELSMHAVAAEAGVSRSTLYRHFSTRAALEDALRVDALHTARRAVEEAIASEGPPLAMLRRIVQALCEVGGAYGDAVVRTLPASAGRSRYEDVSRALLPALERLRRAAELSPAPAPECARLAASHLAQACLQAGAPELDHASDAADALFRNLTDPLDQGLVALDPDGALICINARAARMLDPGMSVQVGDRLTEPRLETLYEDGSPSPGSAYPLGAALRTTEAQRAVRGHRGLGGEVAWTEVEALPLRAPGSESPYAIVGILSDVTAERDWELQRLRPAGQFATKRPVPIDVTRILDEIPPHLFPEQFASEARRISGGPVAVYVVDIDGTHLLRLAGPEDFPERIDAPLALGPELAEDAIHGLKARLEAELPGVTVAPMWLRGRAVGLLLALGADEEPLLEFGHQGAAAMELAGGYTDVFAAAQRRKETRAAAELQQSLLPPRIARIGSGVLAGSVMPSYEVGGDWFDYVENRDGAWIAIADAAGKGATAGALGSIALAALRAARRGDATLEEAAHLMHEIVFDVGRPEFFVTAIVARWNAVYSVFSWINCGHPPPLVVGADGTIEQLMTPPELPLGIFERERRFARRQRRIEEGERLILHSDGITARKTSDGLFGVDGIERAVRASPGRSATSIASSIQEAVMRSAEDPLQDDAVAVVLAPDT